MHVILSREGDKSLDIFNLTIKLIKKEDDNDKEKDNNQFSIVLSSLGCSLIFQFLITTPCNQR